MKTEEKFILGIREHPTFGYMPIPLIVGDCTDEYCRIKRSVVYQDIIDAPNDYNDVEKEIITIVDNFSDPKIYSLFNSNKKHSITDFLSSVDKDIIEKRIRPYIEKHIKYLFDILKVSDVEIYYKPYRYEHIYNSDRIHINPTKGEAIFNFERNEEGLKYYLTVSFNRKEIPIFQKKPIILLNMPALIELEHVLIFIEGIDAKKLLPFYNKEFVPVRKSFELKYFKGFVLKTVRDQKVNTKGFEIFEPEVEKSAKLYIENDWKGEYAIILKFHYNDKIFNNSDDLQNFVELDEKTFNITKYTRDLKWEQGFIDNLLKIGLEYGDNVFKVPYKTKIKEFQHQATINWINENYKKISDLGLGIIQRFSTKKYFLKKIKINFDVQKKIDWFDVYATVTFGDFEIPFLKLKDYILNNISEFELPNGEIAIIPEIWFEKYKSIIKFGKKTSNNHFKISKFHFSAIENIIPKQNKNIELNELNKFFKKPIKNKVDFPKNLKTKLRSYQEIGYSWLNHLKKNNFGGCLADDMGLGKTVQVLATILKSIEDDNKNDDLFSAETEKNINLVVVPRSLLHNWLNEVKKNTPKIKTLIYSGNERERLKSKMKKYDLIVTSYGLARNDIDFFAEINFNYIVLDESQYIKNSSSKTYQAIIRLKGKNKIVITGTPIENSLRDLWTQLNFVNSGLLGSFNFFKDNYITPIERTNDENAKNELKKIISPFILRRTKEEVGKDLPEIEEQTIVCEMSEEQQALYDLEKSRIRNKIVELYDKNEIRKSSFFILQSLTKLRQIANHPLMVQEGDYSSGKFDEIFERLKVITQQKHKILIFSSFVKYLRLFEEKFKELGMLYLILTGKTQNRNEIIKKFEKDKNIQLFLISIKAGGVGLNLTSADYVFILDPWWNPAVEKQAIARAHRIGQTKNVFAFKFITFGTVEEKIQKLQQKKLKLSDEFIDANNYFKYFEDETIVDLFE